MNTVSLFKPKIVILLLLYIITGHHLQAGGVLVTSVFLSNSDGLDIEAAILEGNIRKFDALVDSEDIDNVIVVGGYPQEHNEVPLDELAFIFQEKYTNTTTTRNQKHSISFMMDEPYKPNGTHFQSYGNSNAEPKGSYYRYMELFSEIGKVQVSLLGTPLMIAARARNPYMVKELLARGANPNVFIQVKDFKMNLLELRYRYRRCIPRNQLSVLTETYMGCNDSERQKADECAKLLIEAGATFPIEEDDLGRTALWNIASVRSVYLLNAMHKRGMDLSHQDHLGKTVADYCVEELQNNHKDKALEQFLKELKKLGCKTNKKKSNGTIELMPTKPQAKQNSQPSPFNALQFRTDNSEQREVLNKRITHLHQQLVEARMNVQFAIEHNMGTVSASMRVNEIMQDIRECERQLAGLR